MTTGSGRTAQYRVTGSHWQYVQLTVPEGVGAVRSILSGGDVLPSWATAENIEHLLAVNAIEKVEATS